MIPESFLVLRWSSNNTNVGNKQYSQSNGKTGFSPDVNWQANNLVNPILDP